MGLRRRHLAGLILALAALSISGCPGHKLGGANGGNAQTPASWLVPAWCVAGTGASDSNNCTTCTAGAQGIGPCATNAEIVRRWGTPNPTLAVGVNITEQADIPVSDPFDAAPTFADPAGYMAVTGTLIQVGTATIGTFTPRNRAAGTPNEITASGGASNFWSTACGGTCVGMRAHDTAAGAFFTINQDLGSATAVITEPMASALGASVSPPRYVTIANGDALVINRNSKLYVPHIQSVRSFGYAFSGGTLVGMTFQHINLIGDLLTNDTISTFNECDISAAEVLAPQVVASANSYWTTSMQGAVIAWGGSIQGTPTFYPAANNLSTLDGDVLINHNFHIVGDAGISLGRVYIGPGSSLKDNTQPNLIYLTPQSYGDAELWGAGTLNISNGSAMIVGGSPSTELLLPNLNISGQTTARPFTSGAYGSPVTINAANLATYGALWDPVTGSRIQVQTINN